MRTRIIVLSGSIGIIILNLLFVLALKTFPQIVYGYAAHGRLHKDYPSMTEKESLSRGSFISRYQDETGLTGFLEFKQVYRNGNSVNTEHSLFFVLDCGDKTHLLNESFTEPKRLFRHRKHLVFNLFDKVHPVQIPDTLVLRYGQEAVILIRSTD